MDDLHLACRIPNANYTLGERRNGPQKPLVFPRDIVRAVAAKHGLAFDDLTGDRATRCVAYPRFEAAYELALKTRLSYPAMGRLMGGRDHSTMMSAVRRHCEMHGLPHPRARA